MGRKKLGPSFFPNKKIRPSIEFSPDQKALSKFSIVWIVFYAVSAIFQPFYGSPFELHVSVSTLLFVSVSLAVNIQHLLRETIILSDEERSKSSCMILDWKRAVYAYDVDPLVIYLKKKNIKKNNYKRHFINLRYLRKLHEVKKNDRAVLSYLWIQIFIYK